MVKHRQVVIENNFLKKVITLIIEPERASGVAFLNSQLQASFELTKTGRMSNRFWKIVSINKDETSWEILGRDNDIIDFSFFSNKTKKNMFKKTKMDHNMLQIKLGILGLREISVRNIRKTYDN